MKIERLGPYRIVRELGRGGMGTVYEGVHSETDEPAAVKLLSATLAGEADFRERFAAEIDALRKLNHPNIVRLFGFGRQDDHLFYAMELVDGCSLEQELQRGRRFNWREVTRIGIETCRALRHAHDRGVVHRDIKPANLLMAADGRVKLSDFGIARLFGNARLTNAGSVLGTAEYMAPEQAEGKPAGPRADLYSLGAVFYVLLTNRPLFAAKSFAEMLRKQRVETPDPLERHAPDVPEALQAIVTQLLEKDPDRRIPNPAVLARQLEAMQRALSLEPAPGDPGTIDAENDESDENGENAESPTFDLPAPDDRPSSDAELPETRATGAFQRPGTENPAETEQEPGSRFTPVAAEELDRIESGTSRPPWRLPQTWALLIGLIAVCLAGWYLLHLSRPKHCTRRSPGEPAAKRSSRSTRPKTTFASFCGGFRRTLAARSCANT